MNEIKCPHCHKVFTVDESSYADILNQVRTKEFNEEIHEKLEQIKNQHSSELALVEEKTKNSFDKQLLQKEKELADLQAKLDSGEQDKKIAISSVEADMKEKLTEQEKKITELETKAKSIEKEKEFEVKQALADKEKELLELTAKMNALQTDNKLKIT